MISRARSTSSPHPIPISYCHRRFAKAVLTVTEFV
jgi:hypothetical protein